MIGLWISRHLDYLNWKKVVVIWWLWTIWSAITDILANNSWASEIAVVDSREWALAEAKSNNPDGIVFKMWDVRHINSVARAIKWYDCVYHAAAMKHVSICENDPQESISTNIIGTQNVLEAVLTEEPEYFTFISTDKAVLPSTVMWATKFLAEKLVEKSGKDTQTKMSLVRFGNVLWASGSVLEVRDKQRTQWNKLTITSQDMTRFFMTIEQAANLVLKACKFGNSAETFILKMDSLRIWDLLEAYMEYHNIKSTSW